MTSRMRARGTTSRRAFLRGGALGGSALIAAGLIGCGAGDDEESAPAFTPTARSSAPAGQAGEATPAGAPRSGGVFLGSRTAEPPDLDPLSSTSYAASTTTNYTYPSLLQFVPGTGGAAATGEVEGQLAASYEVLEDGLVMHLQPNAKWESRAPTNSRALTAEDVVFSWSRFEETGLFRTSLSNKASELAPIVSMQAVDDRTVRVQTAFPYGPLLAGLAYTRWLLIMPQESDGGFDPRVETRGAGPWTLSEHQPSVRYVYTKNPNYWNPDRPYVDEIRQPVIAEYAQQLAQFRAGNAWDVLVSQEDIIGTKNDFPELEVFQGDYSRSAHKLYFGFGPDSPFRDERVRRAVSMLIDRETVQDIFQNVPGFEEAGWPVERRVMGTGVAPGYDAFWLDPRSDDFSADERMILEFHPDEAAKLVQAAGHDRISTSFHYTPTQYGSEFARAGDTFAAMIGQTQLFDLSIQKPDYRTEYLPDFVFGKNQFEGIAWGATTTFPTVMEHLFTFYHTAGTYTWVTYDGEDIVASDGLIEQSLRTLDFEEQRELVKQWQHENVMRVPTVDSSHNNGIPPFTLNWPWVKNRNAYRAYLEEAPQTVYPEWWIDESARS